MSGFDKEIDAMKMKKNDESLNEIGKFASEDLRKAAAQPRPLMFRWGRIENVKKIKTGAEMHP